MRETTAGRSRFGLVCCVLAVWALPLTVRAGGAASGKAGPATVSGAVKESALATVTLTEQAEARLGVETVAAEMRPVANSLVVGGEVMGVPGQTATVAAPYACKVHLVHTSASHGDPRRGRRGRGPSAAYR